MQKKKKLTIELGAGPVNMRAALTPPVWIYGQISRAGGTAGS